MAILNIGVDGNIAGLNRDATGWVTRIIVGSIGAGI